MQLHTQFVANDGTTRKIFIPINGLALDLGLYPLSVSVPARFIDARLPAVVNEIIARGDCTRFENAYDGLYFIHITTPLWLADGRKLDVLFPLAWRSPRNRNAPGMRNTNYGVLWTVFAVEHGRFPQQVPGPLPLTAAISPHLRRRYSDLTAEALARFVAPVHFHHHGFRLVGTYHPMGWATFVTGYDPNTAELEFQDFTAALITVA